MEAITEKQNYLREEIMDKGYSPEKFQEFMMQQAGSEDIDLEQWTMQSLQEIVEQFKQITSPVENTENTSNNAISNELEQVNNNEDETNTINNEDNIIQPKTEEKIVSTSNSPSSQMGDSPFDTYEDTVICKKLEPN